MDPSPLIDATALSQRLAARDAIVLLDVRWRLGSGDGAAQYATGHIPGARFVDLEADLAAAPGPGGRHPLPLPEVFAATLRRLGVRRDSPVVVYDDNGAMSAARAWWMVRDMGHRDVAVLDGGLAAWLAIGGRTTSEIPVIEPGDFQALPGSMARIGAEDAAALARSGILLDARATDRYRGAVEPVDPVAGHIPGAISAPTTENLDDDGRFLSSNALAERFASLGVTASSVVGVYCGSGVTAAHEILALELVGVHGALYAGSWSHWVTDGARPVATGATP